MNTVIWTSPYSSFFAERSRVESLSWYMGLAVLSGFAALYLDGFFGTVAVLSFIGTVAFIALSLLRSDHCFVLIELSAENYGLRIRFSEVPSLLSKRVQIETDIPWERIKSIKVEVAEDEYGPDYFVRIELCKGTLPSSNDALVLGFQRDQVQEDSAHRLCSRLNELRPDDIQP